MHDYNLDLSITSQATITLLTTADPPVYSDRDLVTYHLPPVTVVLNKQEQLSIRIWKIAVKFALRIVIIIIIIIIIMIIYSLTKKERANPARVKQAPTSEFCL